MGTIAATYPVMHRMMLRPLAVAVDRRWLVETCECFGVQTICFAHRSRAHLRAQLIDTSCETCGISACSREAVPT